MVSRADAEALAASLVEVAVGAGLPTTAVLTPMDQPLASTAGNALEVRYTLDYLTGVRREPRLHEVVLELGGVMLELAGLAPDRAAGRAAVQRVLDDGSALDRFERMVVGLGGPSDLVAHPDRYLGAAEVVIDVAPDRAGVVTAIDTRAVGLAVVGLGGGRTRPQDPIDPVVGLTVLAELGERVGPDRPLCTVHARDAWAAEAAAAAVRAAYSVEA
jgi:thymidine phosphorylase